MDNKRNETNFNNEILTNTISVREDMTIIDESESDEYNKKNNNNNKKKILTTSSSYSCLEFVKSKLLISIVIVLAFILTLLCIGFVVHIEEENDVTHSIDVWKDKLSEEQLLWYNSGLDELKNALKVKINTKRAKNVILFIGSSMNQNTMTSARIKRYGEDGLLTWEKFPHMGMLKTYCMDKKLSDTTSSATALFCGIKSNYETGGVDSNVNLNNCQATLNPKNQVSSILEWSNDIGQSTGFVTTQRVMHSTISSLYSHVANKRWECDSTMSIDDRKMGCKDISKQLIEDSPGRNINVIFGGGRQCLISNVSGTPIDPIDLDTCYSMDGRNLIRDWKWDKQNKHVNHEILSNNEELRSFNPQENDYVLGIFANGHLSYEHERNIGPKGMPSLAEMTKAAIKVLLKNQHKGFLLVVESGLINKALKNGLPEVALNEVLTLDSAVKETINLMKSKLDETLIIVTADHSNVVTLPEHNNGADQNIKFSYTTLPFGYKTDVVNENDNNKKDDKVKETKVANKERYEIDGDVSIFSIGPMAHLFHKTHENSYVAHVISYAARTGRFRDSNAVKDLTEFLGL